MQTQYIHRHQARQNSVANPVSGSDRLGGLPDAERHPRGDHREVLSLRRCGDTVPLAFCKYLCPMAACLNLLSRIGLIRVRRNPDTCIDCRRCDETCQWGITVSDTARLRSAECSNCQDCVRSCPVPHTLTLHIGWNRS
jgi:ferredoxin